MDERYTLTVEEAAQRLGIGRDLAYRLAREGGIPAIRVGKRFVIPKLALKAWLAAGGQSVRNVDEERAGRTPYAIR